MGILLRLNDGTVNPLHSPATSSSKEPSLQELVEELIFTPGLTLIEQRRFERLIQLRLNRESRLTKRHTISCRNKATPLFMERRLNDLGITNWKIKSLLRPSGKLRLLAASSLMEIKCIIPDLSLQDLSETLLRDLKRSMRSIMNKQQRGG